MDATLRARLAFGGATLIPPAIHADAERLLDAAWDVGIRIFDTAAVYGESEAIIGRWLRRRPGATVVSKCGHHAAQADGSLRSLPIAAADIDRALRQLGVERIDAMLLHSYDRAPLLAGDAVAVLAEAVRQGKIGTWGYSGDGATAVAAMRLPGAGVLECSLSLADQANLDDAIPAAADAGARVLCKRSLANAAWRWIGDPSQAPDDRRIYAQRLAGMGLDPGAWGCAGWSELALRFVLACPGVTAAIVGTSRPQRLAELAAAADRGPLPAPAAAAIRRAFAAARAGAAWPGLN